MNVRLAVQVLSESVSKILQEYYPQEFHGTAELCEKIDKFFNCLNVRNQKEGLVKCKPFLQPFQSTYDGRFYWLENVFLKYLFDWKSSVMTRDENVSQNARDPMFLSSQTFEGLQITVYSVTERVKYLLNSGLKFVLTEKFNQHVVEEHFGRQRGFGRWNDNPTLLEFGYNANTIWMQRSVVTPTGNTRGAHKEKRKESWHVVDNAPLPKGK